MYDAYDMTDMDMATVQEMTSYEEMYDDYEALEDWCDDAFLY